MEDLFKKGFHVAPVDSIDFDGSLAGPFPDLMQALLAQMDVVAKDSDDKRVATEIIYVDDNLNIYVRWKKQWAFEEEDGTVDPRAPLPDILKGENHG